jgi:phage shock protein PspC (stress-responsive transcriptional regulator)
VRVVETISSDPDASDSNDPPTAPGGGELPPPVGRPAGGEVLGGVALDIARRFGVDPVWPRLAFVVLALLDGFGVVLYLGLWLLLIIGSRPGRGVFRILGAAVLFGSIFMLDDIDSPWVDSPWWLAALLAGVAIALWAPRGIPAPAGPVIDHAQTDDRAGTIVASAPPRDRESSLLGRTVLGVAVVVAALGALIDQLNGGRLHPEQWLGAAAAVCGAGMVIGAWRGRGLWLIFPGLLFAGAGFVAGHAARAGVDSLSMGDEDVWIQPGTMDTVRSTRLAGIARLAVIGPPGAGTGRADLRVGIGEIEIDVDDDVAVEIRAVAHDGDVIVNNQERPDGVVRLGPEGTPDVIVDAEISLGDVEIERFDFNRDVDLALEPPAPVPPWLGDDAVLLDEAIDLGDGVRMASDGTVLLPDGFGAIGPNGEVWSPYADAPRADGVRVIITDFGDYLLLPNQMIITPGGVLIDVPARRAELLERRSPVSTTVEGG